jgi:hypothetical protein
VEAQQAITDLLRHRVTAIEENIIRIELGLRT